MGLAIVEMVIAVEAEFGISLPDRELSHVQTVGEFEALVARRMEALEPAARAQLRQRLLDIIVRETAVARDRLVATANLYRDFRLG